MQCLIGGSSNLSKYSILRSGSLTWKAEFLKVIEFCFRDVTGYKLLQIKDMNFYMENILF